MAFLHRMREYVELRRKRAEIHQLLARLESRALADIGLKPDDVADVARLAATHGPQVISIDQVLARLEQERASQSERGGAHTAKAHAVARNTPDRDRMLADAQRLRRDTLADIGRGVRHKLAELGRGAVTAVADTEIGRWAAQKLAWRAAYRDAHAQLSSYSERELMADLRLTKSDIHDIAVEAAHDRVAALAGARHRPRATAWMNADRPA